MPDISLHEYLTDLRTELIAAESTTAEGLQLGVEEITVELTVTHTLAIDANAKVGAKAKFWVFLETSAEAGGSVTSANANAQRLILKLKPRTDTISAEGVQTTGFDVSSRPGAHEDFNTR